MSKPEYEVTMQGRAGILYREGERHMTIDSEMLAKGDFDLVIYVDSIKRWEPPYDNEKLSNEDQTRIRKNIERALKRSRIDWQ